VRSQALPDANQDHRRGPGGAGEGVGGAGGSEGVGVRLKPIR